MFRGFQIILVSVYIDGRVVYYLLSLSTLVKYRTLRLLVLVCVDMCTSSRLYTHIYVQYTRNTPCCACPFTRLFVHFKASKALEAAARETRRLFNLIPYDSESLVLFILHTYYTYCTTCIILYMQYVTTSVLFTYNSCLSNSIKRILSLSFSL